MPDFVLPTKVPKPSNLHGVHLEIDNFHYHIHNSLPTHYNWAI